ncbi:MAG: hypothetical protein ACI4UV_08225 [Victivallales bacterium]
MKKFQKKWIFSETALDFYHRTIILITEIGFYILKNWTKKKKASDEESLNSKRAASEENQIPAGKRQGTPCS